LETDRPTDLQSGTLVSAGNADTITRLMELKHEGRALDKGSEQHGYQKKNLTSNHCAGRVSMAGNCHKIFVNVNDLLHKVASD
jgi:hypothetical protein